MPTVKFVVKPNSSLDFAWPSPDSPQAINLTAIWLEEALQTEEIEDSIIEPIQPQKRRRSIGLSDALKKAAKGAGNIVGRVAHRSKGKVSQKYAFDKVCALPPISGGLKPLFSALAAGD